MGAKPRGLRGPRGFVFFWPTGAQLPATREALRTFLRCANTWMAPEGEPSRANASQRSVPLRGAFLYLPHLGQPRSGRVS